MTAIWIVSVLFALALVVIISGGMLRRVLERIYRGRLRGRAERAIKQRSREELLREVAVGLEALQREQSEVDSQLERERVGRLILRRQDLFGDICRLEDWQSALEQAG